MIYIYSVWSMKSNYTNLSNYLFACVILFMHIKSSKFSLEIQNQFELLNYVFLFIFCSFFFFYFYYFCFRTFVFMYVLIYISGFPTYYSPRQWFDCWFLCIIKVNWINLPTNKFLSIHNIFWFSFVYIHVKCTHNVSK